MSESQENHSLLLRVAYDGSRYSGFVPQTEVVTVADELLRAIRTMDPKAGNLRGTSRTDAGVHAEAQYVVFDTHKLIPPRGWALGLNHALPKDIAVRSAQYVPVGFAPRFHNKGKRYTYRVYASPLRHPFHEARAWHVTDELALDRIDREMQRVLGTHDFTAFCKQEDHRKDRTRTMFKVERADEGNSRFALSIEGDGFLYNMVRILVGTWIDVGRGRLQEGATVRAIESKRREDLGVTAPALGLVLERVDLEIPLLTGLPSEFLGAWPS